jgi:hypothetical protein
MDDNRKNGALGRAGWTLLAVLLLIPFVAIPSGGRAEAVLLRDGPFVLYDGIDVNGHAIEIARYELPIPTVSAVRNADTSTHEKH